MADEPINDRRHPVEHNPAAMCCTARSGASFSAGILSLSSGTLTVISLQPDDDLASVRHRFGWLDSGRVGLALPWDLRFLSRALDFDLLHREAKRHQLELAVISPDPERRRLARKCGFAAFPDVRSAQETASWHTRAPTLPQPPSRHWWNEPVDLRPRRKRRARPWLVAITLLLRIFVFLLVVAVLAASAYITVPSAQVTLRPDGQEFTMIVPVSADPETDAVDQTTRVIPARRVGVEVEGYTQVETTGLFDVPTGRATGQVLFANLLLQDYIVPAGTVVRTSSTSYPIRFRTVADVAVPAGGQALVPVESLSSGVGNVGAYQINQVEGVVSSAVRVINPQRTTGAEPTETRVVTQSDYDRARAQAIRQLLDQAHAEMGQLEVLLPTEFVPRQTLRIEAVPKEAFSRFIGEQADIVGLNMRLLVSGLAVDVDNAEVVAYSALSRRLPEGYSLVTAWFEVGEVAEENIGPGKITIFVTAYGNAAAMLSEDAAVDLIKGQLVADARARLISELPLSADPQITVWPETLERVPLLPMRINIRVVPEDQAEGPRSGPVSMAE